jgi:Fe-S-cluster containining protein
MSLEGGQEGLYGVLAFSAHEIEYRVVIPFVCQRCGTCCRKMGVDLGPMDIERISRHLRLERARFVREYVGDVKTGDNGSLTIVRRKPPAPCSFLTESNACLIYSVRPSPCRSFPIETDSGDSGIGCPGRKLFLKVKGALSSGRGGDFRVGQGAFPRSDSPDDWIFKSTCFKLRKRDIPEEYIEKLVAANGWDVALATGGFRRVPRRRRLT